MVCTRPLPRVELPITTPRPRSASAAARISAALAVRPSTMTTTGSACASSPVLERHSRVASGSRPAVLATTPGGSSMSAALTAWRNSPPRLPRRSRTMPCGRARTGEARSERVRQMAVGAVVEAGDLQHEHVADPLRVDRLRRHHGALYVGGTRAAIAATPDDSDMRVLRPVDPTGHRDGVLAARRLAIDRR